MDEKQKIAFCKQMNIPYTPPPAMGVRAEPRYCAREGCDNDLRRSPSAYKGFCSPSCLNNRHKPKVKRKVCGV